MPTTKSKVVLKYGTQASYDSLVTKDLNTIYFTTDECRIYVGNTEYTRHINIFSSLPGSSAGLPKSFFLIKTSDNNISLYYTEDGTTESSILVSKVHLIDDPGTYGPAEDINLSFGESFAVPNFSIDENGNITEIADRTVTIPNVPSLIKQTSGLGNAVSDITVDGHILTLVKGNFATKQEADRLFSAVDSIEDELSDKVSSVSADEGETDGTFILTVDGDSSEIPIKGLGTAAFVNTEDIASSAQGAKADNAISKYGGTMEGALEVLEPTEDDHAASKKYVDDHMGTNSNKGKIWRCSSNYSSTVSKVNVSTYNDTPSVGDLLWFQDNKVASINSISSTNYSMTSVQFEVLTSAEKERLSNQRYGIVDVTLNSSNWLNDEISVTKPTNITTDDIVIPVPEYAYSSEYSYSQVVISEITTSNIIFTCTSTPISDLVVHLIYLRKYNEV